MSGTKRTVLITGCSDHSLGSALALALHQHGEWHVLATARETSHMAALKQAGIPTLLQLDVLSDDSIQALVDQVSTLTVGPLDMLINSVGGGHYEPFLHLDLRKARRLFDVNVWGFVAVTQAFLPLLMKSADPAPAGRKSIIVNNTSISSVLRTPFHGAYSASKAAMSAFNDTQRVELAPLGIRVVELKTGSLESNFSVHRTNEIDLPADSPYQPIREDVLKVISGEKTEAYAEDQAKWAEDVVSDLLKHLDDPPAQIWRGGAAGTVRTAKAVEAVLPVGVSDAQFQKLGGLDKLGRLLAERQG
ncbi:NAD(P)-binding protein [Teratosphaeria destructans]|uniref:NAD(P)-binding protein n=1 Tax=Teratosphaeria destructans TaxID=418781 RepID=A0A9W7W1N1_9PEZI|nr:NAD(P)-binding protein [Teratosphaeria destructans]